MMHARVDLPALSRDRAVERAIQSRLQLAHEIALERQLARVIAAAGRRAAQAARHGERADRALGDVAGDIARVLVPSLMAAARDFGARVVQAPRSKHAFPFEHKAFEDLDGAIRRHIETDTARRVVAISESLREAIRQVVEAAVAEGIESVGEEELARRIVEATSGEIGMARARRIARTEIHNAAMFGQQAAAEASPLAFEKVWLATEDARTRKSHADANGQRVALDEPFTLTRDDGSEVRLMYPGDVTAPPGETINCRCTCLYEPLPIAKEPSQGDIAQPEEPPGPQPLPARDLEAHPYEREATTVWAAGATLSLSSDGTPRTGDRLDLIGPNTFYNTPDAPEVDRVIAASPATLLGTRRPVLWKVDVPAGAIIPDGLVDELGAGIVVNSGVGRFGLAALVVTAVRKTRWGEAAPKDAVDPDRHLSEAARDEIIKLIASLEGRRETGANEAARTLADRLDREGNAPSVWIVRLRETDWDANDLVMFLGEMQQEGLSLSAQAWVGAALNSIDVIWVPPKKKARELAEILARYLEGEAKLGEFNLTPPSVIRALYDTPWTKQSLARYLERLLAGDLRDEPGPGEPDEHARVILVEATLDLRSAILTD